MEAFLILISIVLTFVLGICAGISIANDMFRGKAREPTKHFTYKMPANVEEWLGQKWDPDRVFACTSGAAPWDRGWVAAMLTYDESSRETARLCHVIQDMGRNAWTAEKAKQNAVKDRNGQDESDTAGD